MTCSREEFLLILKKWMADSQSIIFGFASGDRAFSLSTTVMFAMEGAISAVDEELSFFVIASGNSEFASVGFENASFGYDAGTEFSPLKSKLVRPGVEIDEYMVFKDSSGALISLFTVKSPQP